MNMDVHHRLSCTGTIRLHQTEPGWLKRALDASGDLHCRARHSSEFLRGYLKDSLVMHLWDYKTMASICRMLIHESERVLVFIELGAPFIANNNSTERASRVGGHRAAP